MTQTITFNPQAIIYVDIYKPFESFGRAFYQIVLDADRIMLAEDLIQYVTHNRRRGPEHQIVLKTKFKAPTISVGPGQSYDVLTRALAILDAQNKRRDDVFKWCRVVTVFVEPWSMVARWGVREGHEIHGLSPVSLTINLDEERIPT